MMTALRNTAVQIGGTRLGNDPAGFLDGITPPPWSDDALCARTDPDLFYPDKGGSTKQAKEVCQACPLREICAQWAIDHNEQHGIWGALSPEERRRLGHMSKHPRTSAVLTCQHCGNTFTTDQRVDTRKYCGRICASRASYYLRKNRQQGRAA